MSQGFTRGIPIDTDPNLSLNSDLVVPSQKAVKDYIDTGLNTKQDTITLTTAGTSGPATLIGATLNIPQYGGGGTGQITTYITGNGGVLTNGLKGGYTTINRAVTIVGYYIIGDVSGSVVVDIWKVAYPSIPTVANTIFTGANAGSKPTLSAVQVATVTLPTPVSVSAGDVFAYSVVSANTITGVTIVLKTT